MITDEQILDKAELYDDERDSEYYVGEHFKLGARWMRLMMTTEISDILANCYMQGETCKTNKKIVISVEKMLDLFKEKGYEPELPF
jgi:hypothetical protein